MKLPCAVTRDLLPLYAENMVEEETKELIHQHLAECSECRKRLSELDQDTAAPVDTAKPLQSLKKEIRKRRWYAAVLAALCVFIGVYAYFFHATSMRFVPWQEGLIEVAGIKTLPSADENVDPAPEAKENDPTPTAPPLSCANADEALILNVSSFINGFQEHVFVDDNGTTTVLMQAISTNPLPENPSHIYYEHTLIPVPDRLIYGFEQPQTLLWGPPLEGGTEVLPRLALAYYLMIAAAAAGVCGLAWAVGRKWKYGWVLRQLLFAPVSYILSHLLLKGLKTTSFFLEQDLLSILLVTLALYVLFSIAWQVFRIRRKEA